MTASKSRNLLIPLFALAAILLLPAIYCAPIWWVSLEAPNYPKEAFPDGVRIHFHLTGVLNGCQLVENEEITEDEVLDCVHEMDTINHYVGMYPIASGGVIETAFSLFILAMLGVLVFGFMFVRPGVRLAVMGIAYAAVVAWMAMTWYSPGGIKYHSLGYLSRLASSVSEDMEDMDDSVTLSAGEALIAQLKASLEQSESGTAPEEAEAPVAEVKEEKGEKELQVDQIFLAFVGDQERLPAAERQEWVGSASQVFTWHYEKNLGRYFNIPAEIKPMVAKMTGAAHAVFWIVVVGPALLILAAYKKRLFYWLLILLPILLPVLFVLVFSAWLGWYGHNLHEMGAFTLKPFMPTVFGQGKVAQFTTASYPHFGFGLMVLFSVCLAAAGLLRRKQFAAEGK